MIKKIKWNYHNILGNLELDFTKTDGSIYNTVVFAGENGTGKTTILETLSTFLNLGSFEPFEYISYVINDSQFTITWPPNNKYVGIGFHQRKNENNNTKKLIEAGGGSNLRRIEEDLEDIRHYGVAYSKARSGFQANQINSTTTQQLDNKKYVDDKDDDFTTIKHLIADINAQDNAKWMELTREPNCPSFESFKSSSKMSRFENAFNNFFDSIKFNKVDFTDSNEIKILFKKYDNYIPIDKLSTGEKQIVFRGAHLLKNMNNMSDGIVLIDEPELSMHPRWQEKILKYYRDLFTKNGKQNSQMFIATHSEYVLRSALEDKDNVLIIVLTDNNGQIQSKRIDAPATLPSITLSETNYLAFNIYSIDYHIELYAYLQRMTNNENSVKDCDSYIASQANIYNVKLHSKPSSYTDKYGNVHNYSTLPTYIRNAIDHPDPSKIFTKEELKVSTELLIKLCNQLSNNNPQT